MNIDKFSYIFNRKLIFSNTCINGLSDEISFFGKKAALITGGSSLRKNGTLEKIEKNLKKRGISWSIHQVREEPSPETVDEITAELRGSGIETVAAIGGGSVIDTGKAVSAMLKENAPLSSFLEGIGDKKPSGRKLPFIAVPTTAGTGSESTYNAVFSRVGDNGFKKSLRHENYIADTVLIDPELYYSCPPATAAASGMDALAQLVESYISIKASFFSDLHVVGAIEAVMEALPVIGVENRGEEFCDEECAEAWKKMAYGAYISGGALANCGYCIVHGMAGAIGGYFKAAHGAVCGSLLAAGMKHTVEKLEKTSPESPSLLKFSRLGSVAAKSDDLLPREARFRFIQELENLTEKLEMPRLSDFGISESSLERIAEASSNKNSPVEFSRNEMMEILRDRL